MATFVLVPGGSNGGWYLKGVAQPLQAAGHVVYRCTLTGLGERTHLATPEVGLDTHIQDIVNVLRYEDLHDVILMGHSYGGMVITGVAEQEAERLAHLVYIDAIVPHDGESLTTAFGRDNGAAMLERARTAGNGWLLPVTGANTDWRHSPHPLKCMTQPLAINNPAAAVIPRTYLYCTADKQPGSSYGGISESAQRAREAGWSYHEIDATHSVLRTHPQDVARLLLSLV